MAEATTPRRGPWLGTGGAAIDSATMTDAAFATRISDLATSGDDAVVRLTPGDTKTLAADLTTPPNVRFRGNMGVIETNGFNLTINSPFNAGPYQVFDVSAGGAVSFGAGSVERFLPQWWGAKGDGSTECRAAIQAAIDAAEGAGGVVVLLPGKYLIDDEVVLKNKVELRGAGGFDRSPDPEDTWIKWSGVAAPTKAMIRCSTAAVGTEPSTALSNVRVRNLVLDGVNTTTGDRVGHGLYAAYCINDSRFSDVTVLFTSQHGMWFGKLWYVELSNLIARRNDGCGITIGERPDGSKPAPWNTAWATSSVCNGLELSNLRGHENGLDLTFDESTNLAWGYGVGLFGGNDLVLRTVICEQNDGPGLYFDTGVGAVNGIEGIYLESNCVAAFTRGDATREWGLVVSGRSNARAHWLHGIFLGDSIGTAEGQAIWLTGVEPAGTLVLRDIALGEWTHADWGNWTQEGYVYPGHTGARIIGSDPVPTPKYDRIRDSAAVVRLRATTEGLDQEGLATYIAGSKANVPEATATGFLRLTVPAPATDKYRSATVLIEYSAQLYRQTVTRQCDVFSGRVIATVERHYSNDTTDLINVTVTKGTEVEAGTMPSTSVTFDHVVAGVDDADKTVDIRVTLDTSGLSGTVFRNLTWRAALLHAAGSGSGYGITLAEL